MQILANDFATAWLRLLGELRGGECVSPRGLSCLEKRGVQLKVTDLLANVLVNPLRNLNHRFMVAEWLWIWFGLDDASSIGRYNKNILKFANEQGSFDGAYGPRLLPQLNYVVEQLNQPSSRQAVATIWTPNPAPSKDIPCTVALQCLLRQGKLHTIVTMRSSDIWLGLPYDFFNFSMIANALAAIVSAEPGSLTMQLGSSHLYLTDFQLATNVLDNGDMNEHLRSPCFPKEPLPFELLYTLRGKGHESFNEPWLSYAEILVQPKENALALLRKAGKFIQR